MQYADQLARPFNGDAAERQERVAQRLSSSAVLAEPFRRLNYDSSEGWAWDNYRAVVLALAQARGAMRRRQGEAVRMLEIGGGRGPLLRPAEAAAAEIAVTVNDIDARELSLGPAEFDKAQFDIAGAAPSELHGRFDLVVSRMVMEHVADGRQAWTNMAALLAPGGIAMAFHPTLYAPPFVVNRLFPEALTARLLRFFFPGRHDGGYPKFPARYELCVSDLGKIAPVLKDCGFSEVLIAPIWGHGYFRHIPILREIDTALQRLAEARDWRGLSTYAFTLARR
jgi:2-polyprenyl-3-methyl-5-hydroxy-6-metoxy-1,4-benzoquinol methylase